MDAEAIAPALRCWGIPAIAFFGPVSITAYINKLRGHLSRGQEKRWEDFYYGQNLQLIAVTVLIAVTSYIEEYGLVEDAPLIISPLTLMVICGFLTMSYAMSVLHVNSVRVAKPRPARRSNPLGLALTSFARSWERATHNLHLVNVVGVASFFGTGYVLYLVEHFHA